MVSLLCNMIVSIAILSASTTAFSPTFLSLHSQKSPYHSNNGRFDLHMGSHGIYDIKSDNGVHSISFEVRGSLHLNSRTF